MRLATPLQVSHLFQEEPWFPTKEGYTLIQQVGNENLVEGPRGPKEKEDCEVSFIIYVTDIFHYGGAWEQNVFSSLAPSHVKHCLFFHFFNWRIKEGTLPYSYGNLSGMGK